MINEKEDEVRGELFFQTSLLSRYQIGLDAASVTFSLIVLIYDIINVIMS